MGSRHQHRILLVDDDDATRGGMAELMRLDGYRVVEASDGGEALDTLRAGAAPCLVLLDLNMPGMSGWEFRALQRRDRRIAHLPIVLLSAHGGLEQQAESLQLAGFLPKPIDFDRLRSMIEHTCRRAA